jgi:hypothetical protein
LVACFLEASGHRRSRTSIRALISRLGDP